MERLYVQPNYPARIDSSDPMGALARFAVVGMRMPVELCTQTQPGGTAGTITATPVGIGYVLPTSAAVTWQSNVSGLDPYVGDSFTVCWHGVMRDDTIQQLLTFQSGFGWRLKTYNWGPGQTQVGIETFWGGAFKGAIVTCPDNSLHTIVVRYDGAAMVMEVFFDGVLAGTYGSIKDGGAIMANPSFSMLGVSTKPHIMATAQAFVGRFNDDQVRIWSENPWHIFMPEYDDVSPPGVAGPAPSFKAAWARNSNAVITGAGFR
jgi:hypothetical protein